MKRLSTVVEGDEVKVLDIEASKIEVLCLSSDSDLVHHDELDLDSSHW